MAASPRKAGLASSAVACALLAQLCLAALALRTDHQTVYLFGQPIPETCRWRAQLGLPCPGCGWTRGLVLTLHGDIRAAWAANPAAPLGIIGVAGSALVLLLLSAHQRRRGFTPAWFPRLFAASLAAYGAVCCAAAAVPWIRLLKSP